MFNRKTILAGACPLNTLISKSVSLYQNSLFFLVWEETSLKPGTKTTDIQWTPIGIASWELDYMFYLYVPLEEHGLSKNISGSFFFGFSPTISIVLYSPTLFFLQTSKCFLSNGTNDMHILA